MADKKKKLRKYWKKEKMDVWKWDEYPNLVHLKMKTYIYHPILVHLKTHFSTFMSSYFSTFNVPF